METECVICFKPINNETESKYLIQQRCNCFFNCHESCLIDWLKTSSRCIYCNKDVTYKKKHQPIKQYNEKGCCCTII
jgi:hypothetical protein